MLLNPERKLEKYRLNDIDLKLLMDEFDRKVKEVPPTMEYLRNLIMDIRLFYRIISDPESNISEEAKRDILSAINYFLETEDTIPDWLPLIGYLDDYKIVKYVKEKHREEIENYIQSKRRHFITNYIS